MFSPAWLYWNPDRTLFTIPFLNHPVAWYGVWFVAGFVIGYFILLRLFYEKLPPTKAPHARDLIDRLTGFIVLGTLIGARLGHVLFYDWPLYKSNPWEILKVWHGGLASHGGTLGIIIALLLFHRSIRSRFPELPFLTLLDMFAIPVALGGCFIRIGNFFNQEILGTFSTLPWAVQFGDAPDGLTLPRHPVQLYESAAYLLLCFCFIALWKKTSLKEKPGLLSGLFLVSLFGSRFLLEFFKESQSQVLDLPFLQAGQILSIPFIIGGAALACYASLRKGASCKA